MRKKLIFLLIFFSVPTLTLNETSCFCSKKEIESALIDISNKQFTNFKLEEVLTGDLLYKEVRTQIGSWSVPTLNEDDITKDIKITIKIKDLDNNDISNSPSTEIEAKSYKVNITVANDDQYFKTQDSIDYSITVNSSRNKINISTKIFKDVSLIDFTTGDSLYKEIRTQIGGWAEPTIDENDVIQDQHLTIQIKNSDDAIVGDDNNYTISDDKYKVIIKVDDIDRFFQTQDETEYLINVVPERVKTNISGKLFNAISLADLTTGDSLYKEVRTQIGSWAEPTINADDVKQDLNLTIKIYDSTDFIINDDNAYTVTAGLYKITITIDDGDQYFITQDNIEYPIDVNAVRVKVDISQKQFNDVSYSNIMTGALLNNEVYTQVGNWADPVAIGDNIKIDSKITISILTSDGTIVNNNDDQISSGEYKIKIKVDILDEYFNSQSETEYSINLEPEKVTVDISTKTFNDISYTDVTTGNLLYNEVYKQVGNWADPVVSVDNIKTDKNLIISIWKNKIIVQENDNQIDPGEYSVKITVLENDEYFNTQDAIDYPVNLKVDRTKVDISTKTFNDISYANVTTGELLYEAVATQMGTWADPQINLDDIKADDLKQITILDNNGNLVNYTADPIQTGKYNVKITIDNNDEYFETQDETDYSVNLEPVRVKTDISTKLFNDVSFGEITTGALLYTEVRTQMAGWADPAIIEDDIKQDSNITISILNSSDGIVNDDSNSIQSGKYKIKIKVDILDKYFSSQNETEYSINLEAVRVRTDISTKQLNEISYNDTKTGTLLYKEIRTQIGSWADPTINADDVSLDSNITILIINIDNNNQINDNDDPISSGLYTVKITVNNDDEYFQNQSETEYSVNLKVQRVKTNISENKFNEIPFTNSTTGSILYNKVRTQIGGWAEPVVDKNDIKEDNNIIISILDNGGTIINDDDNLVLTGLYTVKIQINNVDEYFINQAETNYNMSLLIDISNKKFNDISIDDVSWGNVLYNEVYEQIGKWNNPTVGANTIRNDENIVLSIWDDFGLISDDDISIPNEGLVTIKIIINSGDIYFMTQNETEYFLTINWKCKKIKYNQIIFIF